MAKLKLKYGNRHCFLGDMEFDSKREMQRWLVLRQAQDEGRISNLQRQVAYELIPRVTEQVIKQLKTKTEIVERFVQSAIVYVCDFQYEKDGVTIVEDTKISPKMIPTDYRLKEKIFRWKYGFAIRRVYNANEDV